MKTIALHAMTTLLLASSAWAETGDEIVARMDESMTRATDQFFVYQVINEDPGGAQKVMEMQVWVKGDRRLSEFLEPGDMKGMKALVLDRSQMYTYLPAYKKVRRVASSMTAGGFMGTTFSNDDMSTIVYGPIYAAKLVSETADAWVVEATPQQGAQIVYGKLVLTISRRYLQPTEIQYWSTKGVHVKTETRTGYSCLSADGRPDPKGPICNAESMKMVDLTRGGASTELVRVEWKANLGIADDLFSVRSLEP